MTEKREELTSEEQEPRIADLVMLIGRLVQQVRRFDKDNPVAEKAMDYLRRKSLGPSILREQTRIVKHTTEVVEEREPQAAAEAREERT